LPEYRPILPCVLHVETNRVRAVTENVQLIQFDIFSEDEQLIGQDIDIDEPDNLELRVRHEGRHVVGAPQQCDHNGILLSLPSDWHLYAWDFSVLCKTAAPEASTDLADDELLVL
jgi:hypothetical protein